MSVRPRPIIRNAEQDVRESWVTLLSLPRPTPALPVRRSTGCHAGQAGIAAVAAPAAGGWQPFLRGSPIPRRLPVRSCPPTRAARRPSVIVRAGAGFLRPAPLALHPTLGLSLS